MLTHLLYAKAIENPTSVFGAPKITLLSKEKNPN